MLNSNIQVDKKRLDEDDPDQEQVPETRIDVEVPKIKTDLGITETFIWLIMLNISSFKQKSKLKIKFQRKDYEFLMHFDQTQL